MSLVKRMNNESLQAREENKKEVYPDLEGIKLNKLCLFGDKFERKC